jgi:hypothetical protein
VHRCPLCGSAHIVVTFRPRPAGYCFRCDLQWGLDDTPTTGTESSEPGSSKPGEPNASDWNSPVALEVGDLRDESGPRSLKVSRWRRRPGLG